MTDNVTAPFAGSSGPVFATDLHTAESAHWPIYKIGWGTRDSGYVIVDATTGNGQPVNPEGGPSGLSLSAVTSTGTGTAINLRGARSTICCQVSLTGAPSQVVVTIEGTIDGTNWKTLATFDVTNNSNASGDIIRNTGIAVLQARAHLTTLTGGTSPTVSATIAAQ